MAAADWQYLVRAVLEIQNGFTLTHDQLGCTGSFDSHENFYDMEGKRAGQIRCSVRRSIPNESAIFPMDADDFSDLEATYCFDLFCRQLDDSSLQSDHKGQDLSGGQLGLSRRFADGSSLSGSVLWQATDAADDGLSAMLLEDGSMLSDHKGDELSSRQLEDGNLLSDHTGDELSGRQLDNGRLLVYHKGDELSGRQLENGR